MLDHDHEPFAAAAGAVRDGRLFRVAYLVNQYPRNSHSFIRREIRAVEAQGVEVLRFSIRPLAEELSTEEDRQELKRTEILLSGGGLRLLGAALGAVVTRPAKLARALALAIRLGRRSDRGVLRHLAYLAEACLLLGRVRAAGVAHVHAHFGTNSATVALLCRVLGGPPFSFTVHGPEEFDRPESLGLGVKAHHAAFVVAVSSFGRAQLCRWTATEDWAKLRVVHCGVDGAFLRAPRTPVPAAPRLVCVARLGEQKGHPVLLEAAERLAAEEPAFELVLAGDGPLRAQIEARVRSAGLQGRVRVTGWASGDQVRDEILASRALVLPSFAEGLPVVLMEALALGRPVVTTAIAGIPELVQDGVTGWLVPAGSSEDLAVAMRAVLRAAPAELEAMGAAGAKRVAARHDADTEAGRLVLLFREAAGAPDGGQPLAPEVL